MIEKLLKARIPLIQLNTSDPLNVDAILKHYLKGDKVNVCVRQESPPNISGVYLEALNTESIEVLVNVDPEPLAIHIGELLPPKDMILETLHDVFYEDDALEMVGLFNGLTLKQVGEVVRVASSQGEGISKESIITARKLIVPSPKGVEQIDTTLGYYGIDPSLDKWLDTNKDYFFKSDHPDMIPRGILLYGNAGTGKTMASKYIANEWQIPLYRIDFGTMMGKWVGESEGNLTSALRQVDMDSPCVLLMDEIEKIFESSDDSGVASRMLAQLLWWLQEHKSKVLTVMTSNNLEVLPKELYRTGRIDIVHELPLTSPSQAIQFLKQYGKSIGVPKGITTSIVTEILTQFDEHRSHSDWIGLFKNKVKYKKLLLDTENHQQ